MKWFLAKYHLTFWPLLTNLLSKMISLAFSDKMISAKTCFMSLARTKRKAESKVLKVHSGFSFFRKIDIFVLTFFIFFGANSICLFTFMVYQNMFWYDLINLIIFRRIFLRIIYLRLTCCEVQNERQLFWNIIIAWIAST